MQSLTCLILAGGFATRLWPLTEKRAKPLLPLGGKPLICHILEKIPSDIRVILSTNKTFAEDFEALKAVSGMRDFELFLEESQNDKGKMGALAAIAATLKQYQIRTPLLVLAGDNFFGFDLKQFIDKYNGNTILASFDTKSLELSKQYGVITADQGILTSFVEKPSHPTSTLISTGCYLFSPESLPFLIEHAKKSPDHVGTIFEDLLKRNQTIEIFSFSDHWIDIGSFETYLQAQKLFLSPNRIAESSTLIDVKLGSFVDIADHCTIKNSFLENVVILKHCHIENCELRNCVIDEGCSLRNIDLNHKMIRKETCITG